MTDCRSLGAGHHILSDVTRRLRMRFAVAIAGAIILLAASQAQALDAFEIQVYDGTADAPGRPGLELHANTVASGQREAVPPELPAHHQTHLTLEPSLGITRWWEVGMYLQTTVLPDGSFAYSGTKLRSKFVRPDWRSERLRWGVNIEISDLPPSYEPSRWGAEVRPIVAYATATGRFALAFNPILDFDLSGATASGWPSFEPAVSALVVVEGLLSAGLEYYGALGPIDNPSHPSAQQHYLFEVLNVLRWRRLELNVGVGEGLTATSNPLVFKMIVGAQ
jgi:hypothetical protein